MTIRSWKANKQMKNNNRKKPHTKQELSKKWGFLILQLFGTQTWTPTTLKHKEHSSHWNFNLSSFSGANSGLTQQLLLPLSLPYVATSMTLLDSLCSGNSYSKWKCINVSKSHGHHGDARYGNSSKERQSERRKQKKREGMG